MRPVRIGCSGWNYPHWRERVYPRGVPARLWLRRYAELFDTVEVNNTFYRLPKRESVAAWVEESPPGFLFSVKASRYLTHVRRLTDMERGLARFYERLEPLASSPKMGPVLWQLSPTFRRDDQRLASALDRLPPGRHCFEFRHESWFVEEVYALLREHAVALVIGDHPVRPWQAHELTAGWTFVRFHHGTGGETATTPSASSTSGRGASSAGGKTMRSSPTSTTTGRDTPSGTAAGCRGGSGWEELLRDRRARTRRRPQGLRARGR